MKTYLLALCLLIPFTSNANYSWVQKTPMPTVGRFSSTGFVIGNYYYVGSGFYNNLCQKDFWKYDTSTDSWTQIADATSSRAGSSGFSYDGFGFVCIGYNNSPWLWATDLYKYDPALNSWSPKSSLPAAGRYGSACFVLNGTAYVACGNLGSATGPFSNEVWAYDIQADTWSSKATFPGVSRYYTVGFSSPTSGYVGAGAIKLLTGPYVFYDDFYKYDPVNDLWSMVPAYPGGALAAMSSIDLGSQSLVGSGNNSNVGVFANSFYFFDYATDTWSPGPSLPVGMGRTGSVSGSMTTTGFIAAGSIAGVYQNDLWQLANTTSIEDLAAPPITLFMYNEMVYINNSTSTNNLLTIFDVNGKIVLTKQNVDKTFPVNLNKGVYVMRYAEKDKMVTISKVLIN